MTRPAAEGLTPETAARDLFEALGLAVHPAPGDLEIIADAFASAFAAGRAEALREVREQIESKLRSLLAESPAPKEAE